MSTAKKMTNAARSNLRSGRRIIRRGIGILAFGLILAGAVEGLLRFGLGLGNPDRKSVV